MAQGTRASNYYCVLHFQMGVFNFLVLKNRVDKSHLICYNAHIAIFTSLLDALSPVRLRIVGLLRTTV